ncbi:unnamed protein product [Aureobasidium uvarum]|uniref:F-box domain-containing protein n=1 Tax=Aureobasidium uvarum TaxID=2773716 RepID=A0A9N8PUF1_9PEZI|nr:unnamed protein product [Aureobasidium uvarum]
MDELPMELKQRICSFLTPRNLKPLRLTCKTFATAAERYFINRFVLFVHPNSLATLRKIVDHEIFSKYLTTIVYDTVTLSQVLPITVKDPCWDDFRPKTLSLGLNESYATITSRLMRDATKSYQAAWKETQHKKAQLGLLEDLLRYQQDPSVFHHFADEIEYALLQCQRLRNIILSTRHPNKKAKAQVFMHESLCLGWALRRNDIQDIVYRETTNLESLTLIGVKLPRRVSSEDAQVLENLKHLRIKAKQTTSSLSCMQCLFSVTKCLETLSLSVDSCDITKIIKVFRSTSLRVCLMDFKHVQGDALIDFLLHHAPSLQRLALGTGSSDIGWAPVFCSISGELPALKCIQLEALRSRWNRYSMRRDAELQAERFVLSGGLLPLIQYTDWLSRRGEYGLPGRGFFVNGVTRDQLQPGLWSDYEGIANEPWNGYESESENENGSEDGNDDDSEGEEDAGENEDD